MTTAAIIGCAGYAGQETLDRVLAHPALEPVALGSDSLAGKPAWALDPRLGSSLPPFVPNDDAAASGADVLFLCLDGDAAAAFEPPADTVVVDLSGAHRLADDVQAQHWYGTAPGAWSYGLPELYPPKGDLIANPGCYATAALLASGRSPARSKASSSTRSRASPAPAARSRRRRTPARCSRTSRRTPSARTGTHPRSRNSSASPSASSRTSCRSAAACSPRVTCRRRRTCARCSRTRTPTAPSCACCRRDGAGALARAGHRRGGDRRSSPTPRPDRIVICALDNLGKGAAGQAVQNANLALGLDETAGLRLNGVLV
jgi:Acetylglutamate semialdehyde dehydrogenase